MIITVTAGEVRQPEGPDNAGIVELRDSDGTRVWLMLPLWDLETVHQLIDALWVHARAEEGTIDDTHAIEEV